MDRSYVLSIGYKKSSLNQFSTIYKTPVLFMVGENLTRKEFVEFIKKEDEDFDLRTVKFVEELVDTKCTRPQFLTDLRETVINAVEPEA